MELCERYFFFLGLSRPPLFIKESDCPEHLPDSPEQENKGLNDFIEVTKICTGVNVKGIHQNTRNSDAEFQNIVFIIEVWANSQ